MLDLPDRLPTPPDAVLARLVRQALTVRSLWFATRDEAEAWDKSGCPLYVRPLAPDRIEIGPRLGAMWASVFSPALQADLTAHANGTAVRWTRRLPRLTFAVLTVWWILIIVWGAALAVGVQTRGLPFWAFTVACTASAPVVGRVRGGRVLDAGLPWLSEVLLAPDDEEDW
jgi:hypothetical protein